MVSDKECANDKAEGMKRSQQMTGKGCESESRLFVSSSLRPHRHIYSPWNSPGPNTGVGRAVPFSRESSQPRDQTQVSHLAGGFFTS